MTDIVLTGGDDYNLAHARFCQKIWHNRSCIKSAVDLTERLTRYWDFSEDQLADLSIFHLVNILMLLAGQYGYIGQFAPTIYAPAASPWR